MTVFRSRIRHANASIKSESQHTAESALRPSKPLRNDCATAFLCASSLSYPVCSRFKRIGRRKPPGPYGKEGNMAYCQVCGSEIKSGAKFCGKCGTPIPAGDQAQTDARPAAGASAQPADGTPAQPASSTQPTTSTQPAPAPAASPAHAAASTTSISKPNLPAPPITQSRTESG